MLRPEARRTLIYVPIIHSQGDMGSLGQHLPADLARHRVAQVHWVESQQRVRALGLDWPAVKVYQDGLPDAPREMLEEILANVLSPNYDLLRWLVAQGAELIGTESPALMKEEYDLLRAVLTARDATTRARARRVYAKRAAALLAERDDYIARRIAETLLPGESGLLFVGQAHRVAEHLPTDIAVHLLTQERTTPAPTNPHAV